jgi:GT2 family glycosyltransferase
MAPSFRAEPGTVRCRYEVTVAVARPDLSVSILSWNTREYLRRCLQSLYQPEAPEVAEVLLRAGLSPGEAADALDPARIEVIVIDNASADGSADMVAAEFPHVRLVRNTANTGFSGGNNQAYEMSQGRWFLLLNSDTVVAPGSLAELVAFADKHTEAGMVGPRVVNPDGSVQMSCRRFPTLTAGLFRNTPLGRLFPKNRFARDYLMADWRHDSVRDVDWLSGCALLVRRETVEQIGPMDDGYFMYCEDVDWCWRAHAAGWQVLYYPCAPIVHWGGRSTDLAAVRMIVQFHRSMYRFFCKHYASVSNPLVRPLVIAGILARASGVLARTGLLTLKRRIHGWK